MNFLITGATGFIGSHVLMNLINHKHTATVLARDKNKIPKLTSINGVDLLEWKIGDSIVDLAKVKNIDTLIHIALGWGDEPETMLLNDTLGSVKLFNEAIQIGVKRIIYTSSTAAAGEMFRVMSENMPTKPVDLYGATKAATENYLLGICQGKKVKVSCSVIRPGYTYGNPAVEGGCTQPDKRFETIVKNCLNNTDIELVKYDGTQFIDAADIADLYRIVALSDCDREIFYALGNNFISWVDIAKIAKELTSSSSQIKIIDKGYGKEPYLFDISKAQTFFGFVSDSNLVKIQAHLKYLIKKFKNC